MAEYRCGRVDMDGVPLDPKEREERERLLRMRKRYSGIATISGLASLTSLGFMVGSSCESKNPYQDRPIVSDYDSAVVSLRELELAKRNFWGSPNLPYEIEGAEPHLRKAFGNRDSLDEAIKIYKTRIEELKNDPEYKEYKNWRLEPTDPLYFWTIAFAICGIIGSLSERKRKKAHGEFQRRGFWEERY